MIAWSNASLLRILARKFTKNLPASEHRLKSQLNDNTRSVVANIEEGFARPTTSEYLTFLGYSQASLIEAKGDIQRSLQDGFLRSHPGYKLMDLGINLSDWHEALKDTVISKPFDSKGIYGDLEDIKGKYSERKILFRPFIFNYLPVDNFNFRNLTYELFIELINKTDWNLRKLVESLENKLVKENKFYEIEKLRLKGKLKIY